MLTQSSFIEFSTEVDMLLWGMAGIEPAPRCGNRTPSVTPDSAPPLPWPTTLRGPAAYLLSFPTLTAYLLSFPSLAAYLLSFPSPAAYLLSFPSLSFSPTLPPPFRQQGLCGGPVLHHLCRSAAALPLADRPAAIRQATGRGRGGGERLAIRQATWRGRGGGCPSSRP